MVTATIFVARRPVRLAFQLLEQELERRTVVATLVVAADRFPSQQADAQISR